MARRIVKYPVATTFNVSQNGKVLNVNYRGTNVVSISLDNKVTLNSGGYRTNTTKHRMNQYGGGVSVYQRKGQWFVDFNGKTYDFFDGIVLG